MFYVFTHTQPRIHYLLIPALDHASKGGEAVAAGEPVGALVLLKDVVHAHARGGAARVAHLPKHALPRGDFRLTPRGVGVEVAGALVLE